MKQSRVLRKRTGKKGQRALPAGAWYVYMLRCRDGSLYTGITTDVTRRCGQHNAGTASACTRSRRPVVVVYRETVASRSAALKREAAIKRLTKRAKELLVGRGH